MVKQCILAIGAVAVVSIASGASSLGGMPCENPEQFQRWYETYEQKTGKEETAVSNGEEPNPYEAEVEVDTTASSCAKDTEKDVSEVPMPTEQHGTRFGETKKVVNCEQETSEESETATDEILPKGEETAESDVESVPNEVGTEVETEAKSVYMVNGELVDPTIQQMLYDALERHNISYWLEGALAQIYQESHFQQYIVSNDGRDYGILQYRAEFWDEVSSQYGHVGADIYDMYVQFDIYAAQMSKRFNSGMSVADAVSRHKTSDYGGYDAQYYAEVSQWFGKVAKVEVQSN